MTENATQGLNTADLSSLSHGDHLVHRGDLYMVVYGPETKLGGVLVAQLGTGYVEEWDGDSQVVPLDCTMVNTFLGDLDIAMAVYKVREGYAR